MATSETLYWCRIDGNFGKSTTLGDEMPKNVDPVTLKELKARGYVSATKPATALDAKASEVKTLRESNKSLQGELATLQSKNEKLIKENAEAKAVLAKVSLADDLKAENVELKEQIAEMQAELEDAPKSVKEANAKIKELKKQIDELTSPGK